MDKQSYSVESRSERNGLFPEEVMEEKDNELAKEGKLTPENIFTFNIIQDGDVLQELVIKNFDAKRLKELKSSTRWTLEKMYEKTEEMH